jgi:hypothetical protein
MNIFETSGDRTPLGDLTNTISGCQSASNTRLQLIDPKECKRAREQAHYASISLDQMPQDRLNLVTQVFKAKLEELKTRHVGCTFFPSSLTCILLLKFMT